jgi:hypothetical protein
MIALELVVRQNGKTLYGLFEGNGGSPGSSGIGPELMDRLEAILACCEDPRDDVKKAGLGALKLCKSYFLNPDQAADDIPAWRECLNWYAPKG